jgi:hypothetical protein
MIHRPVALSANTTANATVEWIFKLRRVGRGEPGLLGLLGRGERGQLARWRAR